MTISGEGLARSRRWAIGAIGAAVVLVALAPLSWAQQSYTMKLATATINDIQHQWQKQFKKRLEARAGGRLKVKIYPASQLGSIPRMIEGLLLGTVESFVTPTAFMVGTEPRFQIMDAPGVFDGPEHIHRIINDPKFRRHILGLAEKKGLKGVAIFFNSPMVILSRKPIRTFADFKGQKIRTFASPLQTAPLQRLGATPVPMPLSAPATRAKKESTPARKIIPLARTSEGASSACRASASALTESTGKTQGMRLRRIPPKSANRIAWPRESGGTR